MISLRVFLCFEGRVHTPPWCLGVLEKLSEACQLSLHVIYNGFPANYDAHLSQISTSYQTSRLPLQLGRKEIIRHLLEQPAHSELSLFISANVLWSPPAMEDWLVQLQSEHMWITPTWLEGRSRSEQALAMMPSQTQSTQMAQLSVTQFPAIFGWHSKDQDLLLNQLKSQADFVFTQDTSNLAWAEAPASQGKLSWLESEHLWAKACTDGSAAAFAAIQELAPESPALYQFWLDASPNPDKPAVLNEAFSRGVLSPKLLHQAQAVYRSQGIQDAAQACSMLAAGLYGQTQTSSQAWNPALLKAFLQTYPRLPAPETLSVCMIVKNEAAVLERCLSSVKAVADEIIVVDTGSDDETPQLAESFGARVIHWQWQQDFAAARNVSLAHASSDWILVLDADDALEAFSEATIRQFLFDPPPGLPRCQLRINNIHNDGRPGLLHYVGRLFPHHPDIVFKDRIHETVTYLGSGVSFQPVLEGIQLKHIGYISDIYTTKQKARRNLKLLLEIHADEPEAPEWMFYLGDSSMAAQEPEQALHWLLKALDYWPTKSSSALYNRNLIRALQVYRELGRYEELLELAESYRNRLEQIPDYWYVIGQTKLAQDQEGQALSAFKRCLNFQDTPAELDYYDLDVVHRAPLLEITQIYRRQLLKQSLSEPEDLQATLIDLLEYFPDGIWRAHEYNLLTLLAQCCLAIYHRDKTLSLDPLMPYSNQLYGRSGLNVLLWLWPQNHQAEQVMVNLSSEQVQAFRQEQEFRTNLALELWNQGEAGKSLAETIFALSDLLSPALESSLQYALCFHQTGDSLSALRVIRDAQLLFPAHPVLLNNRAMLLFGLGQPEAAIAELQECLNLHPDFKEAQDNLKQLEDWLQRQNN